MKAAERDKELHELALEGLIARRDQLNDRIAALRSVVEDMQPHPMKAIVEEVIGKRAARKRRKLSPEVRRKMAASQQKRWARAKKASVKTAAQPIKLKDFKVTASKPTPKPKRNRKKVQKSAAVEAA